MIPLNSITHWRDHAPWVFDWQVEQDLVICRALIELFNLPALSETLAFRGGTALHKIHLAPAVRYSEDIDLVQTVSGPIGPVLDGIHECLDPWLGTPRYQSKANMVTLKYRFAAETIPPVPLRLKVEINTREPMVLLGVIREPFLVEAPWFSGRADIPTFALEEMLGTKLRALYQRRKGRDVFDLVHALDRRPDLDRDTVVRCFTSYMSREGTPPTQAEFLDNLAEKRGNADFMADIHTLLPATHGGYDPAMGLSRIEREFIQRMV